jgi:hypothetical protein
MSLINIIQDDFIAHFDTATVVDEHANVVQYSLTSPEGLIHTVYIDPRTHLVSLSVAASDGSGMNTILYNITNIRCERKDKQVKFYFYQGARPEPIAEFMVEPSIFVTVDVQS